MLLLGDNTYAASSCGRRSNLASAIGRCSNNWTHAEIRLASIFGHLTNTTLTVAVTVFSFFKATHNQRSVIKKLCKITPFITDDLNTRLNCALKEYIALAEARNELLHNPIGRSVENEVCIMLRTTIPDANKIPYHTKPLRQPKLMISQKDKNVESWIFGHRAGNFHRKIWRPNATLCEIGVGPSDQLLPAEHDPCCMTGDRRNKRCRPG
jgi:hypothetical protein